MVRLYILVKNAAERFLRNVLGALGEFVIRHPAMTRMVKPERPPGHWLLRKVWVAMFGVRALQSGGESFSCIRFDDFDVLFSNGPLVDERGIGRVCREQLRGLAALSTQTVQTVTRRENTDRPAVYFYASIHWCPSVIAPNTVIMIHDVIPLLFPKEFSGVWINQWRRQFKLIAAQAAHIVTISQSSAQEITRMFGVPREKISIVYNGVVTLPIARTNDFQFPDRPYVVFLGSGDAHKNLKIIFKALAHPLLRGQVDLVMIGNNKNYSNVLEVKNLGLKNNVHFLGQISDEYMGYILTKSKGLVFPSLYEGFGLPPMEAALLGVPSICSNRPAMNETLEGAALFVEPDDVQGWAAAIHRLIHEPGIGESIGAEAKARAREFTWEASVTRLLQVLKALARQ